MQSFQCKMIGLDVFTNSLKRIRANHPPADACSCIIAVRLAKASADTPFEIENFENIKLA